MFGLYRCVGGYNMNLQYHRYHCTHPMFLLVDNSDSPSIVEQSQQGHDSSCYTLLTVIPSSVKIPIPLCLSASLLQHEYILLHSFVSLSLCVLTFPMFFSSTTTTTTGALQPLFIQGVFAWKPGIVCLTMCSLR